MDRRLPDGFKSDHNLDKVAQAIQLRRSCAAEVLEIAAGMEARLNNLSQQYAGKLYSVARCQMPNPGAGAKPAPPPDMPELFAQLHGNFQAMLVYVQELEDLLERTEL